MKISPPLISSAFHSQVFEMKGEFQVKGRKRDFYFLSAAPFPCFSLSLIFKWLEFYPLSIAVVGYVIFTVCFWSGCSSLGEMSVWGKEDWTVCGTDGPGRRSQDGMAEGWALQ